MQAERIPQLCDQARQRTQYHLETPGAIHHGGSEVRCLELAAKSTTLALQSIQPAVGMSGVWLLRGGKVGMGNGFTGQ